MEAKGTIKQTGTASPYFLSLALYLSVSLALYSYLSLSFLSFLSLSLSLSLSLLLTDSQLCVLELRDLLLQGNKYFYYYNMDSELSLTQR